MQWCGIAVLFKFPKWGCGSRSLHEQLEGCGRPWCPQVTQIQTPRSPSKYRQNWWQATFRFRMYLGLIFFVNDCILNSIGSKLIDLERLFEHLKGKVASFHLSREWYLELLRISLAGFWGAPSFYGLHHHQHLSKYRGHLMLCLLEENTSNKERDLSIIDNVIDMKGWKCSVKITHNVSAWGASIDYQRQLSAWEGKVLDTTPNLGLKFWYGYCI